MSGGLKPISHFGIVLLVGVLLSLGLYFLPKTVVKNEVATDGNSASSTSPEGKGSDHAVLNAEQEQKLKTIKASNLSGEEMNQSLVDFFSEQNVFDSAGYYTGIIAEATNSEESWLKAGDYYYQAYSLSLNPVKREELAEKTRSVYQKVLTLNPNQLQAKTNMAMTYSTSSSPMQAVLLLRQVLDQEPRFVPALMSLGALSMQSGQYDKAVSRFQQVLGIAPGNLNAQLGLAYSWIEVGEKEKAKALLLDLSKQNVGDVLQNEINNTLKSLN